ncbi:MAG: glutamate--tRNA ligase [Ectothiorhodospiraceae bacterium]|nr:glutamate--tRNA ligase [Ectothiorhodospiraceae bacterium]
MQEAHPRVRFAPSPTGYLHVGGARTAIFNWLYAKKNNGTFLLRIEDTDKQRSSDEMTQAILDGLTWLGIDWEGEPWSQSAQAERHAQEARRLLEEGKAYYCYLTPEELQQMRADAEAKGEPYWYGRAGLRMPEEERQRREREGYAKTLRFKVPEGETTVEDLVHGTITFEHKEIDDFIVLRSDGSPVYMLSVVVDDHDMGMTHIIRGDDHLSNTPKQVLLYQALGYDVPAFGHVPLILGTDKKRLSKRHGATAVGEYHERGFLPEAVFNYLSLLGFSPGDDREILSRTEMIEAFTPDRLQISSAVFDEQKLLWLNGQYLRMMDAKQLSQALDPFLTKEWKQLDNTYVKDVIGLMSERITTLSEFCDAAAYFVHDPAEYDEKGVRKHWKSPIVDALPELIATLESIEFTDEALESAIRAHAERLDVGAGKVIQPLRLAITGGTASPGMFETMRVLGKETCLRRLRSALKAIPVSDS